MCILGTHKHHFRHSPHLRRSCLPKAGCSPSSFPNRMFHSPQRQRQSHTPPESCILHRWRIRKTHRCTKLERRSCKRRRRCTPRRDKTCNCKALAQGSCRRCCPCNLVLSCRTSRRNHKHRARKPWRSDRSCMRRESRSPSQVQECRCRCRRSRRDCSWPQFHPCSRKSATRRKPHCR